MRKRGAGMSQTVHDCYRLGFGEPAAISAATGEGMADLYSAMQPRVDAVRARLYEQAGLLLPQPEGGRRGYYAKGRSTRPTQSEASTTALITEAYQDAEKEAEDDFEEDEEEDEEEGEELLSSSSSGRGAEKSSCVATTASPRFGVIKLALMGQPNVVRL